MVHASLPITSLRAFSGAVSYVWVELRNPKPKDGDIPDRIQRGPIGSELVSVAQATPNSF